MGAAGVRAPSLHTSCGQVRNTESKSQIVNHAGLSTPNTHRAGPWPPLQTGTRGHTTPSSRWQLCPPHLQPCVLCVSWWGPHPEQRRTCLSTNMTTWVLATGVGVRDTSYGDASLDPWKAQGQRGQVGSLGLCCLGVSASPTPAASVPPMCSATFPTPCAQPVFASKCCHLPQQPTRLSSLHVRTIEGYGSSKEKTQMSPHEEGCWQAGGQRTCRRF